MNNSKQTNLAPANHRDLAHLPITFYPALDEHYDLWAAEIGTPPLLLRQLTVAAIRTRHHEARFAHGRVPPVVRPCDVYELPLDTCSVYFSVESSAIVVRGYGWNIPREPLDDFDGGGFYS